MSLRRWAGVLIVVAVVGVAACGRAAGSASTVGSLPADIAVPGAPDVVFADAMTGFVMLGRCPTDECEAWVGVTHDAGRSWAGAPVPGLTFARGKSPSVSLLVFDATHVVLNDFFDRSFASSARWVTADGGASWSAGPDAGIATVDAIPPGAWMRASLRKPLGDGVEVDIITPDGGSATLATPPVPSQSLAGGGGVTGGVPIAADGSRYLAVSGGYPPTWQSIFRTADDGRTWTELAWPAGANPANTFDILPTDGVNIYLHESGGDVSSSFTGRVFRSADAGATWDELHPAAAGEVVAEARGLPNGGLAVSVGASYGLDASQLTYLELAPGASSFTPIDGFPLTQPELAWRNNDPGLLTPDGEWAKLAFTILPVFNY